MTAPVRATYVIKWDRRVYVNSHKYHRPTVHAHLSNCLLPQHFCPSDFRHLCKLTDISPVAEFTQVSHLSAIGKKVVLQNRGSLLCNLNSRDKQQLAGISQPALTMPFDLPATASLQVHLGCVHTSFKNVALP